MQALKKNESEKLIVESWKTPSSPLPFSEHKKGVREILVATPYRGASVKQICPIKKPAYIRLALEQLNCFEVVDHQFAHWGIRLENAIAIQPSNPAYGVDAGVILLMGSPQTGKISIFFKEPVQFVSASVTSSRRTLLSAMDQTGQVITQSQLFGPNLAGSKSEVPPCAQLSVRGENISQVTFYAFDGQITLHNLIVEL